MYLPRTQHVQGVGLVAELSSFFASGFGKAITSVATEVAKVGVTSLVTKQGGGKNKDNQQSALLQQQLAYQQQQQALAAQQKPAISPSTMALIGVGALGLLYVVTKLK